MSDNTCIHLYYIMKKLPFQVYLDRGEADLLKNGLDIFESAAARMLVVAERVIGEGDNDAEEGRPSHD